jgi:hypothetical protein
MRHDQDAAARMAGGTAPDASVGGAVVWVDVTLVSSVCDTDNTLGEHTDTLSACPRAARKVHLTRTDPTDVGTNTRHLTDDVTGSCS